MQTTQAASRPHFLDHYDTSGIIGFGKPYRGTIHASHHPEKGDRFDGTLGAPRRRITSISTSAVVDFQRLDLADHPIYGTISTYLIETQNSVYIGVVFGG